LNLKFEIWFEISNPKSKWRSFL